MHQEEWEKTKMDLITAKNKGIDRVESFRSVYKSIEGFINIEDFEVKQGVKVPDDIAALLREICAIFSRLPPL